MENNSAKKLLRNFVGFISLMLLTLWIILKDQSILDILAVLKDVKIIYVLIGILCMFAYIFLEALNLRRTLKILNEKITLFQAYKYAFIGFFFSGITPAASGGQPMQVYYMHKDKISVANSTLALLMNLIGVQIVTITFALISAIFNYKYVNQVLIILFVIGVSLNAMALTVLIIGIFSKRLSKWLIRVTVKILTLFKVKNKWKVRRKLLTELKKYHGSAAYIRGNKKIIFKILATTFVQFAIFYSISYWTYRALGFSEINIFEITTMQSALYATVSGIPSPGAVGVSEGAFIEIYRNIYPTHMIKSATLLNRGINFYLFMFISGIVVIVNEIKCRRNE